MTSFYRSLLVITVWLNFLRERYRERERERERVRERGTKEGGGEEKLLAQIVVVRCPSVKVRLASYDSIDFVASSILSSLENNGPTGSTTDRREDRSVSVAITRETASSQQAARGGKAQCSPRVRSSTLPARASVLVSERPRPRLAGSGSRIYSSFSRVFDRRAEFVRSFVASTRSIHRSFAVRI